MGLSKKGLLTTGNRAWSICPQFLFCQIWGKLIFCRLWTDKFWPTYLEIKICSSIVPSRWNLGTKITHFNQENAVNSINKASNIWHADCRVSFLALECGDSKPTVCLCWSERLGGLSPAPLDLVRTSEGSLGPPPPSRYWGNSPTPLSRGFHMGEPKRNHLGWNNMTKLAFFLQFCSLIRDFHPQ